MDRRDPAQQEHQALIPLLEAAEQRGQFQREMHWSLDPLVIQEKTDRLLQPGKQEKQVLYRLALTPSPQPNHP